MKLIIDKDRKVYTAGTWGTKNENDFEILDFEFPEELDGYNKRIVYYLGDEKVWDAIVDNKAYITNAITTKGNVKAYVWCTKENTEREADTDFRTMLFEMHFYENENADGIVPTPEQVDGFNTMLTAMNEKIEEIDELETTIENAETQRQENEETRQENESTRQENEQTRQEQEAERERRTDEAIGNIKDKTAEYNANAEAKTTAFNNNATQKTNDFNSNYTQKVNDFNTNASSKELAFNSNAESKTSTFNTNATNKRNDFNSNASSKTTAFNSNATDKTTNFDNNASSKTTTFNENATSKTNDFNDNATQKTTDFNNNAQAKTEAFDEHTEEMQQEIDELSANMPWAETEQATEIQVTDAAKYSRNKLELFGNTEQASYSGKNLFDTSLLPITANGITITKDNAGNIVINGTPNYSSNYKTFTVGTAKNIEAGTYTVSVANKQVGIGVQTNIPGDNLNLTMAETTTAKTYTTTDTTSMSSTINIRYDVGTLNNFILNPQFELSSTATDYEPYVGGVPAPNPDYPQDIHVVTGNNTVKRTGKNLLDLTNAREEETYNGITCTKQDDGTYTFVGTSTSSTVNFFPLGSFANYNTFTDYESFDKSKILFDLAPGTYTVKDIVLFMVFEDNTKMATSLNIETGGVNTFTLTQTGHVVALRTPQCENGKTYDIVLYPQLEKSSTATSFEPYHLEEYQVNLGDIELCKIGDYQDYLYKENGNWYKYNAIEKYVYNNDLAYNATSENFISVLTPALNIGILSQSQLIYISYCNMFTTYPINNTGFNGTTNNHKIRINISFSYATTLAEVKALCEEKSLSIYYGAETPTSTQITDETLISQLDEIYEHFKLVKGTNNITVTAEDLAPYMELTYMQDQQKKFENIINSTYTNVMEGEY